MLPGGCPGERSGESGPLRPGGGIPPGPPRPEVTSGGGLGPSIGCLGGGRLELDVYDLSLGGGTGEMGEPLISKPAIRFSTPISIEPPRFLIGPGGGWLSQVAPPGGIGFPYLSLAVLFN